MRLGRLGSIVYWSGVIALLLDALPYAAALMLVGIAIWDLAEHDARRRSNGVYSRSP